MNAPLATPNIPAWNTQLRSTGRSYGGSRPSARLCSTLWTKFHMARCLADEYTSVSMESNTTST